MMRYYGSLALLALALMGGVAWGQQPSGPGVPQCHTPIGNAKGTAGAAITVSNTAVTVVDANTINCDAIIFNNSANNMRCAGSNDRVPTSTQGFLIVGGAALQVGGAARQAWACIRTGASDASAEVQEFRTP